MQNTANYQLPTYEATDNANLLDGYNEAMDKIDAQMKANSDATVVAATAANNAQQAASTAATNATAALENASAAVNTANAASQLATTAQGTAEAASTAASQAQSTANSANTNASAAVATANEALSAVSPGHKLIIIGDSFTTDNRTNWTTMLEDFPAANIYKYAENGSGFISEGSSGHTFAELYAQAKAAVTGNSDAANIYAVIFYGGTNDRSGEGSACATAVRNLYTQIRTDFPNARPLMCLFNAGMLSQTRYKGYDLFIDACANSLSTGSTNGPTPYVNTLYWLWGSGKNEFESDLLHPAPEGMRRIAQHMTALLRGEPLNMLPRIWTYTTDLGTMRVEFTADGNTQFRGYFEGVNATSDNVVATLTDFAGGKFPQDVTQNMPLPYVSDNPNVAGVYCSPSGSIHVRVSQSVSNAKVWFYN